MAILRQLFPVASPAVSLKRRQANMADPNFYQQGQEQIQQQEEQYQNEPLTGEYLKASLAKLAQRQAPPQLDPIARVRQPDMSVVAPDNFRGYYENMGLIKQMGEEQLGAEQARAAYRKMQELQALQAQQPGPFQGAGSTTQGRSSGGRSGGNDYGSAIPSNPQANFKFAQQVAPQFGWTGNELNAWYTLGMKESGWRNTAQNPTSTAFGIGQFLNSTWKTVGMAKTSDPYQQVLAMAKYIKQRYGSPSAALAFHRRNNWY